MDPKTQISRDLEALYRAEFYDPEPDTKGDSREDRIWRRRVEESICWREEKLQVDLPFRNPELTMPCNTEQALGSAKQLRRRLLRDPVLRREYIDFMQKMISNNHLEIVPENEMAGESGKKWYLVHLPVRHKRKGKLRVVFDCSRKIEGLSLNDVLLQGPDLLNRLVGVLLRFREHPWAFIGDIEQMFLQLKVPRKHADFMRVFWWSNGDLSAEPKQHRLTRHTFGAVSSPSIANFAMKRAAEIAKDYCDIARDALHRGAYMDDVLCSTPV